MRGAPKANTTLRLDSALKEKTAAIAAEHGMTLTGAVEEFMVETVYRGEPAVRMSEEAHLACERIRFRRMQGEESGCGGAESWKGATR